MKRARRSKVVTSMNGRTRCSPSCVGLYQKDCKQLRGYISREFIVEERERPPETEIYNESRI